jgi:heat shock protein HslJ
MSGGTGCRNYAATYYASPDAIKVNLPQADQVACSDAQTEAEQGYFLGLNSARDYRIIGNELFVYYDTFVHIFMGSYPTVVIDAPLAPLDGTQWWLASIDTFQVVPGTEVTLLFDINPDGRTGTVSGSGGCNTYSAQIIDHFALSQISATSALCDTPAGIMEQESAYLSALGAANGVFLEGDTLRITTPQQTLFFNNVGPAPAQPTPTPDVSLDLPITAVISAPTEGQVDQALTFDGSSSTASADIASYAWTFSDGFTAEGAVIEHSFAEAGSYDVVLTVTDVDGNIADASIVVVIQ